MFVWFMQIIVLYRTTGVIFIGLEKLGPIERGTIKKMTEFKEFESLMDNNNEVIKRIIFYVNQSL